MTRRNPHHRWRERRGLSLPEVLVAVTIGAGLVAGAVTFAFSMTELWGAGSDSRVFDQHVRGVSRFLDNMLRYAEPPPQVSGSSLNTQPSLEEQEATRANTPPVVWQPPRGNAYGSEELLTFELPDSPGILAWPAQPLPFVVCSLRVDRNRGLFLLWKSRLEIDFADGAPREFRLSPFVTGITYFYYDDSGTRSSWEARDQPEARSRNEKAVPARIRLHFAYRGMERTADIVIPGASSGVPVF